MPPIVNVVNVLVYIRMIEINTITITYSTNHVYHDFAFAFKTQNAPCVSRFERVLLSDRFQFCVLNSNETFVWLVNAFDASYIAHYRSNGYAPYIAHYIAQMDLTSGFGNISPSAHRSQIKICEKRQMRNVQFRFMPKAFRILKPIQKSSKRIWVFRHTDANAVAKNQTRLAYEDKHDLYCMCSVKLTDSMCSHLKITRVISQTKSRFAICERD